MCEFLLYYVVLLEILPPPLGRGKEYRLSIITIILNAQMLRSAINGAYYTVNGIICLWNCVVSRLQGCIALLTQSHLMLKLWELLKIAAYVCEMLITPNQI